ncbi:MAG: mercury resistance system transport protein MerF [Candidatus Methylomirabilis oxyfera]|nr:mercury resistance system transport protein MerF [Candidatus Methylomirabilis oxyfera]
MIGTALACIACFTPLAVTLLGVIGLAGWAGYLDYVLFPLLAVCVGFLLVGLVRRRSDSAKLKGEN